MGSFAATELEGMLGCPGPARFTAVTRNSYSVSSSKPSTLNLVSKEADITSFQFNPFIKSCCPST